MRELKKHGWKLVVIALLFGIAGRMDYEHEVKHEAVAKAYYDELNQRYVRDYAALDAQDLHDQILRDRYSHE